jgi:uncharacterized membrane protein YkgB
VKTLLLKFNWRLIIIHFLASCLFLLAFREFMYISDYQYFKSAYKLIEKNNWHFDGHRIETDINNIDYAGLVGIVLAFIISLAISIKRRWFWVNSLLVFLIAFLTARFVVKIPLGFYISYLYFHTLHRWVELTVTATIILSIALGLFFSRYSMKFIDTGAYKKPQPDLSDSSFPTKQD